jgi:hypothetical protein
MTIDERSPEQIVCEAILEAEKDGRSVVLQVAPRIVVGMVRAFQIAAAHPSIEFNNSPAIEIAHDVCETMVETLWQDAKVWAALERNWHGVWSPFSSDMADPEKTMPFSLDDDDVADDYDSEEEFYERESLARMALDALNNGQVEEAKEYLEDLLEDE